MTFLIIFLNDKEIKHDIFLLLSSMKNVKSE